MPSEALNPEEAADDLFHLRVAQDAADYETVEAVIKEYRTADVV